ncbi:J domain-containing protein [Marinobacter zhanjiangensis]|uniref:J domain-containing protein n=1 Tax=Marinobacter zhanjiangensis TaxID=578215 RepID=A0ABQ3AV14_9GAMM|nr:J domain-containing protein [Marinobacter zhanjiangensis]GGY67187.1 hypothetical protein GCM10007071_12710 [Marinobacter zhanjiangensis]
MNCWEILGIEPTRDTTRIRDAFEHQRRFAGGDEAGRLQDAYEQAMAEAGHEVHEPRHESAATGEQMSDPSTWQSQSRAAPLSAADRQVVREVVIQVNAMLNDSARLNDVAIWRAILTEPPADQEALRAAIGEELEPKLRPLAEDAQMAAPVARFLGDWFGWYGMTDALEREGHDDDPGLDDAGRFQGINFPDSEGADSTRQGDQERPQMTNFWPAVIGWIVGIVILTSLFGAMTGGGG